MFKKLSVSAVAVFSLASMSAAAVNFDNPKANNLADEINSVAVDIPSPVVPVAARAAGIKEWTIMVFLNGKNDLEENAIKDLNEMEMVGSSDRVNVVVELGRMDGYDTSNGDWKGTRRYLVKKDAEPSKITSPVLQDLGKTDMGDYKSVIAFGKWAKAAYPAKKTMLIIWNHGSGWIKTTKSADAEKGISYDQETNHHITTPQMAAILKEVGGVDVYGSDACLMQMAEVVYEIKDHAKFIVGSEEVAPSDGYAYNDFLAPLIASPVMNAETLAKLAVDAYSNYYLGRKMGSTHSYIKSANIPGFLSAVNDFAYAITAAGEKNLTRKAMGAARAYRYYENKDLFHFTQLVVAETKSAAVKEKGAALMVYIKKELVGHNRTTNSFLANYTNSSGIAIYLPMAAPAPGYDELQWSKYSNWDEFIKWYQLP